MAFIFCFILLIPLKTEGDVIFFKDGMKTVCQEKAWEEGEEIKCEYSGAILSYQKKDVIRIEKVRTEKQPVSPSDQTQSPIETTAEPATVDPEVKQPPASDKNHPFKTNPKPSQKSLTVLKQRDWNFITPDAPKNTGPVQTQNTMVLRKPSQRWQKSMIAHRNGFNIIWGKPMTFMKSIKIYRLAN